QDAKQLANTIVRSFLQYQGAETAVIQRIGWLGTGVRAERRHQTDHERRLHRNDRAAAAAAVEDVRGVAVPAEPALTRQERVARRERVVARCTRFVQASGPDVTRSAHCRLELIRLKKPRELSVLQRPLIWRAVNRREQLVDGVVAVLIAGFGDDAEN